MRFVTTSIRRPVIVLLAASLLVIGLRPLIFNANAISLPNRSVALSDSKPSATTSYKFAFDIPSSSDIGSIRFQFCSDSPLIGTACTAPTGFDATAAVLSDQTGETGFSIGSGSTANEIILTRTAATPVPGPVSYTFDSIVNPSTSGPYYARAETFLSEDATGPNTDYGGLAFSINDELQISTTVPPFLLFCSGVTISGTDCTTASGDYVNFGELSSTSPRFGSTQMVIATNAMFGYSLTINGTTMLSGTNVIPALTANDVSRPGTGQFGVNLRNNSDPNVGADPSGTGSAAVTANYNIPNRYRFVTGEQIATSSSTDAYRKYTVSYVVNVAKGQAPGVYVSTITYICLATF